MAANPANKPAGVCANHKFGSAARSTIGPDNDMDLLVVVSNGVHRRKTAQAIYKI